jgi:hypothetical protein
MGKGTARRYHAPAGYPKPVGSERIRGETVSKQALFRALGKETVLDLIATLSGYGKDGKPVFAPNLPESMRKQLRQVLTEGLNRHRNSRENIRRRREFMTHRDRVTRTDTSCTLDASVQARIETLMLIYDVTTFEELCKETNCGSFRELAELLKEQEL